MKRFLILLTLAAFVFSVPLAIAQSSTDIKGSGDKPAGMDKPAGIEKPGSPEKGNSVNCCVKGKCKTVTGEADCTKEGGKVVKDCKECK